MSAQVAFAIPPTFTTTFKNPAITNNGDNDTFIAPNSLWIDANRTLWENIYAMFSPSNNSSILWNMIRTIMVWILVLYFAWTGIDFIMNPNDEWKNKQARRSFYYMLFGAFLIYWVTSILGSSLSIGNLWWWAEYASNIFVSNVTTRIIFQVLTFLKAFAFFYAIVIVIWYWLLMIRALDKEDAIKSAKTGLVNVIVALIFIKVIDFVFFIAQDVSFASRLKQFLLSLSRAVGYILWAVMVLSLIYAWYKYISAQWDESKVKDAKNVLTTIFYVILIIFLFLLVAWQVIAQFT